MKSTIKVDFAGVDDAANQFRPVIRVNLVESDDTRDKLLKSFFDSLGYESNWLVVQFDPKRESSFPHRITISPVEPKELKETGNLIYERLQEKLKPLSEIIEEIDQSALKPFITAKFGDNWKEHAKKEYTEDAILDIAWKQGRRAILLERLLSQIYPHETQVSEKEVGQN